MRQISALFPPTKNIFPAATKSVPSRRYQLFRIRRSSSLSWRYALFPLRRSSPDGRLSFLRERSPTGARPDLTHILCNPFRTLPDRASARGQAWICGSFLLICISPGTPLCYHVKKNIKKTGTLLASRSLSLSQQSTEPSQDGTYPCNPMITTVLNLFKSFEETFDSSKFQDIYDDFIDLILLPLILKDQLICPFCREEGRSGHFTLWSVYSRLIRTGRKSNDRNGTEPESDSKKTERIRIRRIRCTCCRHTHAILPELIVPYSSLPAGLHLKLVQAILEDKDKAAEDLRQEYCSERSEKRIRRLFLEKWKERLHKTGASLDSPISVITKKCVSAFREQFMQPGPVSASVFLLEDLVPEDALAVAVRARDP